VDRRRFLSLGLSSALLIGVGRTAAETVGLEALSHSGREELHGRVVTVTDLIPASVKLASNRDALPRARVPGRLAAGMEALLGPEPWARLFSSADVVAIKINGLASGTLSPRPEIVQAIVAGLRSAGVRPGKIIIWDRTTREVERSGFPMQTGADDVRSYGTDALRGGGYSSDIESFGSVGSLVSSIVSRYATALINVGVLKHHDLAGLSAGMKNLYGVIHNPNRYHENGCDPFVAEVTALPSVRKRLRLTVIDAVLAQAEGGPAYAAQWIWPCDRILLAVDPVACDQVAWELLEAERRRRGLPSLEETERCPHWIATAARLGLGWNETLKIVDV
jgi:uncharacterized protein (DUF362 family)